MKTKYLEHLLSDEGLLEAISKYKEEMLRLSAVANETSLTGQDLEFLKEKIARLEDKLKYCLKEKNRRKL